MNIDRRIWDNSKLYNEYDLEACGLSADCKKYFIEESCFYECDKNVGKWRKHSDCDDDGEENGWEITNMPIKASYWDAWYEACKNDYFAWGTGGTYWDIPTGTAASNKVAGAANKTKDSYTTCSKFSDTYKNGKEVAEIMWAGSFTYETNEDQAYVMTFEEGTSNPNNLKFTEKNYPAECVGHEVNITHPGIDIDGTTRLTYSEVGCPADWHTKSGVGLSPRNADGTLIVSSTAVSTHTYRTAFSITFSLFLIFYTVF